MPKIWLIGAGSLLATLLVASIIVALVQRVEPLPEGTPERAVQLYLAAIADGDLEAARDFLSAELKEQCSIEDLARRRYASRELEDSRITLEGTEPVGGKMIVTARVTRLRSNSPFGSSENSYDQLYTLVEEDGSWRFTSDPWPYQGCMKPVRVEPAAPASVPTVTPTPVAAPTPAAATVESGPGDSR